MKNIKIVLITIVSILVIYFLAYSFIKTNRARQLKEIVLKKKEVQPSISEIKPLEEKGVSGKISVQPRQEVSREIKKEEPATIQEPKAKISFLQELGFLVGYAKGDLEEKKDYKIIPMSVHLGFDLKPFLRKFNFTLKGMVQFVWEPFINTVTTPNKNVEVGNSWLIKYAFPLTKKVYPYIEGGVGIVYMSQHTREQATQFNFVDQVGAGVQYFIKDNVAVNVGYRYRHLSNASIKHPNSGIDVDMVLTGVSLFF